MVDAPALLTSQQAANYLNVPKRTLDSWRHRRTGPEFIRLGRLVRYEQATLERFVDARRQQETPCPTPS